MKFDQRRGDAAVPCPEQTAGWFRDRDESRRRAFFDHGLQEHRGLVLVEQDKLRIDVGFDGELVQQTRTETVNRGNDRAFERAFVT